MTELLLCTRGEKPRAALTRDRRLLEYMELEAPCAVSPETVLLGRAGRVMKSLGAMFVQLPEGREGFLPFSEMAADAQPQPGDAMVVQVKKPPLGNKAAYLSMDVSLVGRLAMLLPLGGAAHASRRAGDPAALGALAGQLRPEGMGLVLRANAEGASRQDILSEISLHLAAWGDILAKSRNLRAPAVLREAPGALARLLRDVQDMPQRTVTDDEKAAAALGVPLVMSDDPFALYGVEGQLYQALRRRVYLPSGGTLVLDPCEAATLIDVNTAGDTRKAGDLILRTNLEAAAEIARLLRLRRIGGVILIDFIGMKEKDQQDAVLSKLKEALRGDRVVSEVLGFTRLGLVEMTRRKGETPIPAQRLSEGDEEMPESGPAMEEEDA